MQAQSASAANAKLLRLKALKIYRSAASIDDPAKKGGLYFRVNLLLEEIFHRYPDSLTAIRFRRGRSRIDVEAVGKAAAEWARRYPKQAAALKKGAKKRRVAKESGPSAFRPVTGRITKSKPVRQKTPPSNGVDSRDTPTAAPDDGSAKPQRATNLNFPSFFNRKGQFDPAKVTPVDPFTARKMTTTQLVKKLERSVVKIAFVAVGNGKFVFIDLGTGFFITPRHVMTNAHIAEAESDVRKKYGLGGFFLIISRHVRMHQAKLLSIARRDTSLRIDAALLEVEGYRNQTFLDFAFQVEKGERISMGGFPGRAMQQGRADSELKRLVEQKVTDIPDYAIPELLFETGVLSRIYTEIDSRARTLQYSIETSGGNSGSPVVNACGEIVGLHYSGTRAFLDLKKVSKNKVMAVGDTSKYNSAVALSELIDYLRRKSVPYRQRSRPCQVG